ncbi:MAG: recombination protein RecR [Anaerofustis stercorihominis]|nr:recombination protein RecR [Anaerofustis stercorihominis]
MAYSQSLNELVAALSKLPGIGRKSAQRIAYHLVTSDEEYVKNLSDAILNAKEKTHYCSVCNDMTEDEICPICASDKRDRSLICVVAEPKDVVAIEKTKEYKGLYHVLGGLISPMDGIGPNDISISKLIGRLNGEVKEVILATSLSVEGETTAMYIARMIAPLGVATSRIAKGIPAGSELEYADEATIANALEGRRKI